MSARKKLNQAAVFGGFVFATILGTMSQSWIIFVIVFVFLVASSLYAGDIRLHRRH